MLLNVFWQDVISESEMSMAPTDIYLSPLSSPRRLSMVDMTLTSDIEKYDLHRHAQHERRGESHQQAVRLYFSDQELSW